jgi:pyridoxine 4-dehydrogenase
VDNIQRALGTIKKLDLFEPARVDPKLPIEQIMQNLVTLLKEGKFFHIGLSECNADTLRKAHAVEYTLLLSHKASLFTIQNDRFTLSPLPRLRSAHGNMEITKRESSPLLRSWAFPFLLTRECNFTCATEGQIAHSSSRPLGKGFLTGQIKSPADLPGM